MLHLKQDVYAYNYLNQSGCSYVLTMDDDKQFTVTTVSCSETYPLLSCSPDFLHWEQNHTLDLFKFLKFLQFYTISTLAMDGKNSHFNTILSILHN